MVGKIIVLVTLLGLGIMCYGIGAYAKRSEKPMAFWSGTEVAPSEITDVKAYNLENARMWKLYSLWYFIGAAVEIWAPVIGTVLMVLGCTVGIVFLILDYNRIYKKYRAK